MSELSGSPGFKVTVQAGKNVVARIKSSGEMRVGIDRMGSLTREGMVSSDRALTYLRNLWSRELVDLVNKAKQLKRSGSSLARNKYRRRAPHPHAETRTESCAQRKTVRRRYTRLVSRTCCAQDLTPWGWRLGTGLAPCAVPGHCSF